MKEKARNAGKEAHARERIERYAIRRNPANPTTFQVVDLRENNKPQTALDFIEFGDAERYAARLNGRKQK